MPENNNESMEMKEEDQTTNLGHTEWRMMAQSSHNQRWQKLLQMEKKTSQRGRWKWNELDFFTQMTFNHLQISFI
jgi:hypothetical protein